ncbi:MFS transporter [Candidatus Paracaedibacter symbiosus]|uniref:MFS transporter n=1 Tax=Candidatus Paracaedibacter symbiosus TaxID=244582 RepID=UPI000509AAB3|nr:MFS transporter [Candidatus Paracaedibacter symbiosus]
MQNTKKHISSSKIIISCFAGNLLEWYEFAIFGFLTPYISQLFFPSDNPTTSLLLTYGIFATGFVMRPLGAIIAGHIGDLYGRKFSLVLSLLMMTIPTTAIGLLPTFNQIGIYAPFLILCCRLIQGISLGGEFSGSIIYLIENAPPQRRGFFGSWADMGSSMGMILATLTSLALTFALDKQQILDWGWRLPFLLGIIFGILGLVMRRKLAETPEFLASTTPLIKSPIREAILKDPLKFLLSITFLAINATGYYLLVIYLPQQATSESSLYLSFVSLILMMPATFIGATLSDKIGQYKMLLFGICASMLTIIPAVYATYYLPSIWIFIYHGLFSISLGLCFGPRSSFIVQLYPVPYRCSGVAISYNIANAVFGGTAPLMAMLMVELTGSKLSPGFLILAMALLSLISTIMLNRYRLAVIFGEASLKKSA